MENNIKFYSCFDDVFTIYGLYEPSEENGLKRMPDEAAKTLTAPLAVEQQLYKNTAGGRIRFRTDAKSITVRAKLDPADYCANGNILLRRNFDVYRKWGNKSIFETNFATWAENFKQGNLLETKPLCGTMQEYTIYLPCYGNIYSLEFGFPEDATVEKASEYTIKEPIVYLGSSITQGGCAQRPGLQFQAFVERNLDADFINLGFSGSCWAEKELMEYISTLTMSAFVYDYDHNSPSVEYYDESHLRGYKIIREANPDLPIILLSRGDLKLNSEDDISKRIIVQKTYHYAIEKGDKNVYYIDGYSLFEGTDHSECTTDGCHPNDIGMKRMGDTLTNILQYAIYKPSMLPVIKRIDI